MKKTLNSLHVVFIIALNLVGHHARAAGLTVEQAAYRDSLVAAADRMSLADDSHWLKLTHYKKTLLGGWESEVAGESFFLSPKGKTDPRAELLATIDGLFSTQERPYPLPFTGGGNDRQVPRCQFPARFSWLKAKLKIDPTRLPQVSCERFEKYRDSVNAKSVTLIFSSYYLNNPSSSFGHSLLRLNKGTGGAGDAKRFELLDHGINFAAEVTTDNSLVFAIKGLIGLFRGTYSDVPYYYKVREYNDFETRDLWSYDLNLTAEEMELLVAHIWELGATYYRYYYFTQNCSYQILTAIEAAAPRYDIVSGLAPYVIPGDTVKRIMEVPGLVARFSYRPSVRAQFKKRFALLSKDETVLLQDVLSEKTVPQFNREIASESKARILDTALDYLDYKHPESLTDPKGESAVWRQKLLMARASVPVKSETLAVTPPLEESPHRGHGSARLSVGGGRENQVGAYSQLHMRFALHDPLDPVVGYPENSQIEFFNAGVRYLLDRDRKRIELEDFALIRILSLSPLTSFNKSLSWKVELGGRRFRDGNCDRCFGGGLEMGFGYSWQPVDEGPVTLFGFGEMEAMYSPSFLQAKWRPGAGPTLGLIAGGSKLRLMAKAGYRYYAFSAEQNCFPVTGEARWNFSDSFALGVTGKRWSERNWDGLVSTHFYF